MKSTTCRKYSAFAATTRSALSLAGTGSKTLVLPWRHCVSLLEHLSSALLGFTKNEAEIYIFSK